MNILRLKWSGILSIMLVFPCSLLFPFNHTISDYSKVRVKQYRVDDCERLVVLSPARTGSTLLYNVLRYLFEGEYEEQKVYKYHNPHYLKKNDRLFIPLRDPIEAVYSQARVFAKKNRSPICIEDLRHCALSALTQYHQCNQLLKGNKKALHIKYEKDLQDLSILLEKIEQFTSIQIDEQDKQNIVYLFSKDSIRDFIRSRDLRNFSQTDTETQFHGDHIADVKENEAFEIKSGVRKYIRKILLSKRELFASLGYKLK